jgi:hypothetical protein
MTSWRFATACAFADVVTTVAFPSNSQVGTPLSVVVAAEPDDAPRSTVANTELTTARMDNVGRA